MDNSGVVEVVNQLLLDNDNHEKWVQAYQRYVTNLIANKDKYSEARKLFRLPKPMYAYSSITMASNSSMFDIRVHGQSIGSIQVKKNGKVILKVSKEKASHTHEYFLLQDYPIDNKEWGTSSEARTFRAMFKDKEFGKLKSEEHRIENLLLAEFSKRLRSDEKVLCNIQPVTLSNCFFQLTTPISASDHSHSPTFSMDRRNAATGGGIDILARIKHSAADTRLAIIELKDENTKTEPQKVVMAQALAYATFVAHLLRSKTGDKWWHLFKFSSNMPEVIKLDVVSLMPKGESEEGSLNPIFLSQLGVILTPHTLYYEADDKGRILSFSGTLLDHVL
ncbi:MAG: hypothetical protein IKH24_00385 [Bacteroidales bacterium]|nr:hypothetical protein [Bacteroidales bacterium]